MSAYTETPVATPPLRDGDVWLTCAAGTGPHDVADVVIGDGGLRNVMACRCGQLLSGAPYTTGYRSGTRERVGRQDLLVQHQRATAGLCVHCGRASCWCHMTVGS